MQVGKSKVTTRFATFARTLPAVQCMPMTSVDLHITAGKEHVGEPWLWRLGREFNVRVNIIRATVDEDFGWMHVRLEGPVEDIQRATAWLMTTGMHIEALQRAVGVSN